MKSTPNINKITRRYDLQKSTNTPPYFRWGISGKVVVSHVKHAENTEKTLSGAMC